ncbi:hypothetical protein SDRG_14480 [Saprolegnia diclina VS20]|uniref:Uncharacterized protein n=1 Tax=Saprolegnia diclina (strain VS20) TaxID=1156394 RepID=T0PQF4_SAPDV|nr:hypothetical protein SDRG_14480 [Saprolegnia diclina VS20]EQC27729.1 hypothetical protein SDRG_14480 [Saprolegnia diclina VS20]|eukprot:XP_008618834.1 hypothetical protein SDRG_14480 [Saprolegnia diclina VS20]
MPSTFRSVVLAQPDIAAIIFDYQYGVFEDVRAALYACRELLELHAGTYECDVAYQTTFAPNAVWRRDHRTSFEPVEYALHCQLPDDRMPLHVAIVEGFDLLAQRIVRCRPALASIDAIFLAIRENRLEMAAFLLEHRTSRPELYRRTQLETGDHFSYRFSRHWLCSALARSDTRGIELIQRVDPSPEMVTESNCRHAIFDATLENATLACTVLPWFNSPRLFDIVAGQGFLPLVRRLHDRGSECSTGAMDSWNGHLEVVRFLHEHRREGCTTRAMDTAARHGHFEVVKFLHFNRTEGCSYKAHYEAILQGRVDIVRFLLEHRGENASPNLLDFAAANGQLEIVQYLNGLGTFHCTVDAVDSAARRVHLALVQYLVANRNEGGTRDDVVRTALEYGQLHTAEYLLSLGYPFPARPLWRMTAAAPGMVDVIQFCLTRGMRWNSDWLVNACEANNVPLVQLILEHPRASRSYRDALERAVKYKAWDAVRYVLANTKVRVTADMLEHALPHGDVEIVAQMLSRRIRVHRDDNTLLEMASSSHLTEMTRLLLDAGLGRPRDCLYKIAGRPKHVTEAKLLLPYCMDATNAIGNVDFLLRLVALTARRRTTTLQLVTTELLSQGRKASEAIRLPPSVEARATMLLQAGEVVDWAMALALGHLWTADVMFRVQWQSAWSTVVHDEALKAQLAHLLSTKRKFSGLSRY